MANQIEAYAFIACSAEDCDKTYSSAGWAFKHTARVGHDINTIIGICAITEDGKREYLKTITYPGVPWHTLRGKHGYRILDAGLSNREIERSFDKPA